MLTLMNDNNGQPEQRTIPDITPTKHHCVYSIIEEALWYSYREVVTLGEDPDYVTFKQGFSSTNPDNGGYVMAAPTADKVEGLINLFLDINYDANGPRL